jgi:hypothetical protein
MTITITKIAMVNILSRSNDNLSLRSGTRKIRLKVIQMFTSWWPCVIQAFEVFGFNPPNLLFRNRLGRFYHKTFR